MRHRVIEDWMGEQVETLEDLLRPGLRAVFVGINPARTSVAAGHYYQGRLGHTYGKSLLTEKIEMVVPKHVVFTFKKTATILFGSFPGSGLIDRRIGEAEVFVMPGPYAPGTTVEAQLAELRRLLSG